MSVPCAPEPRLSPSAQRVQAALEASGFAHLRVYESAESTRTAEEAAAAVGCAVGQIVKSLIFCTRETRRPILALTAGHNRVHEKTLARLVGEGLERADPAFVREVTGFAIGGVAPLGHPAPILTFIDEDLLTQGDLWAAAGTPNAVFGLSAAALVTLTNGRVAAFTRRPAGA